MKAYVRRGVDMNKLGFVNHIGRCCRLCVVCRLDVLFIRGDIHLQFRHAKAVYRDVGGTHRLFFTAHLGPSGENKVGIIPLKPKVGTAVN